MAKKDKTQAYRIGSFIISALLIAIVIKASFVSTFKITSAQMLPNLVPGDVAVGFKLPFSMLGEMLSKVLPGAIPALKRGDIIIYEEEDFLFVKRVVALAGDDVSLQNGLLQINGKALDYEILDISISQIIGGDYQAFYEMNNGSKYPIMIEKAVEYQEFDYIIPPGSVLVLGDGDRKSVRFKDVVKVEQIKSRLFMIFSSYDWGAKLTEGGLQWRKDRMFIWL